MNVNWLYFLQLCVVLLLLLGIYQITIEVPKRKNYILLQMSLSPKKQYVDYQCSILKENLYAFQKYEIWRYIERKKANLVF